MFNASSRPENEGILVLDYGSQYTLLIARRLREIGVYAEVVDGRLEFPPAHFTVRGVILSGGPDSVTEQHARRIPKWVLASKVPILGICYGMQMLVEEFGGKMRSNNAREYGKATVQLSPDMQPKAAAVFYNIPTTQRVWMSHGDDVQNLGKEFIGVGKTEAGVEAAIVHRSLPIVGLQFHPEVQHTDFGQIILSQFVQLLCGARLNWQAARILETAAEHIRSTVKGGHVLMAVSGGVDSTVAATLMVKTLGADKVTAVFVDHGLLRKNERQWVSENLRFLGIKNLVVLDKSELFLGRLKDVSDPEQKRKLIGATFIEVFEQFAHETDHHTFTHLGQGTLYPDVIESAGHGAGAKVIKTHHNVGGLPEKLKLALVEPFRFLFKDEVRRVGEELAIPEALIHRHPFPGPGLAIRVIGAVSKENLELLQAADAIFIDALKADGYYNKVWQAFVVLLPVKSVGVMGDNRTYEQTIALRTVVSADGMTASVGELPLEFLISVADKIVRQVPGVNRVVYDVTSKPPATIEWE